MISRQESLLSHRIRARKMLSLTHARMMTDLAAVKNAGVCHLMQVLTDVVDEELDEENSINRLEFPEPLQKLLQQARGAGSSPVHDATCAAVERASAHLPGLVFASISTGDDEANLIQQMTAMQMAATKEALVIDLSRSQGFVTFAAKHNRQELSECIESQRFGASRSLLDDWDTFRRPGNSDGQPPTWLVHLNNTDSGVKCFPKATNLTTIRVLALADFSCLDKNGRLHDRQYATVSARLTGLERSLEMDATGMTWSAMQAWVFSLCGGYRFGRPAPITIILLDGNKSTHLTKCVAGISSTALFSMSPLFRNNPKCGWMEWQLTRLPTSLWEQTVAEETVGRFAELPLQHRVWWILLNVFRPKSSFFKQIGAFVITSSSETGKYTLKATHTSSVVDTSEDSDYMFTFTAPTDTGFEQFFLRVVQEALLVESIVSETAVSLDPANAVAPLPPRSDKSAEQQAEQRDSMQCDESLPDSLYQMFSDDIDCFAELSFPEPFDLDDPTVWG